MRLAVLRVATIVAFGATSADAQATPCASAPLAAQDACYAAVDYFQYMTPQLGISLTGGNVILGQGGSNGGLPRFSIGVRGNVVAGNLPDPQQPSETGPAFRIAANPYPTTDQYLGLPAVDASIGLFRGFNVGFTSVGGVDALVSAVFIPTVTTTAFSIEPDSPLKIGYGARLGLIEETVLVPGIAVNVMLRDLPTTSMLATVGSDSLQVTALSVKTTSWRVTAGKSFVGLSLAAGFGQDLYDASTGIEAIVNRPAPIGRVTTGLLNTSQKITRTNYFGNLSLNLLAAKLVAEAGMISGGDIPTSNVFDVAANASRIYGSVGLRIGF